MPDKIIKLNVTASGDGKNRDELTRKSDYVAILTKNFCQNDNCIGELRDAVEMKIPMYAIIKKDDEIFDWILKLNWTKKIYFNNEKDMPNVAKTLMNEIARSEPIG